jgi:hypothetical protein
LSQSSPTPTTREPFAVVVREAVGEPELPLAVPVAPIDPEGNPRIVIDESTFCDKVAVTVIPDTCDVAVAAQSSAVPNWEYCELPCLDDNAAARFTNAQCKTSPVLVTLVTVVLAELTLSAAMHTSSSSFGYAVENGRLTIVSFGEPLSVEVFTSMV